MSTRQVAAAAPEVMPARHTLRAEAPDRYPLKVSIDQECEQGLRLLADTAYSGFMVKNPLHRSWTVLESDHLFTLARRLDR